MADTRLIELGDRLRKGSRLSARKLNRLIDAINALERRKAFRAIDANDWVGCLSTDSFDTYSVVEVYGATFDAEGILLLVRPVGSTSGTGTGTGTGSADDNDIFYAANENYPLYAGEKGWVKIVPCAPNFVVARATGAGVSFGDNLDVSSGAVTAGDGPLKAASGEQPGDRRLVNITADCSADSNNSIPRGECACCPGEACYPGEDDIITDCEDVPCAYANWQIIGLPTHIQAEVNLAHVSGCIWESDTFDLITCAGTDAETNHGPHHWRMTPAANIHDSKLELIGDINLEYYAVWYFHPNASNEFGYKPDCAVLAEIAAIGGFVPPRKLCVMPLAPECEQCQVQPIPSNCCEQGYPVALTASITSALCAAVNGATVALTYSGTVGVGASEQHVWLGTFDAGACGTMTFEFRIFVAVPCEYSMEMRHADTSICWGDVNDGVFPVSLDCTLITGVSKTASWNGAGGCFCGDCGSGMSVTATVHA